MARHSDRQVARRSGYSIDDGRRAGRAAAGALGLVREDELGVDLVLVGTLHDYDTQAATGPGQSGHVPVLALTLRIVDGRTGTIVWAANAARRGTDRETVFGIGERA